FLYHPLSTSLTSPLSLHDALPIFAPGEMLLLYTDGVTEAVNEDGGDYGDERLKECLQTSSRESPGEIIRDVLRSVTYFSGGLTQADDITMLAVQYRG